MSIREIAEELAYRGQWLGIAYLKASGGDLQLLMKLCGNPTSSKLAQNMGRLELAMFYLSKCAEIVGPQVRERYAELTEAEASQIEKIFLDAARKILGDLFPKQSKNISNSYACYNDATDKSAVLLKRLNEHGLNEL